MTRALSAAMAGPSKAKDPGLVSTSCRSRFCPSRLFHRAMKSCTPTAEDRGEDSQSEGLVCSGEGQGEAWSSSRYLYTIIRVFSST